MQTRPDPQILGWIAGAEACPIEEKLVPGASEMERRHLAALGSLGAALLGTPPMEMPVEVANWFHSPLLAAPEVVTRLREQIQQSPDSALADLYATIVAPKNRRHLGTFFTPAGEVHLMLEMCDRAKINPSSVVDIGAGVGVFTAAASNKWPDSAVYATDVNPVTLGLLAVQMHERGKLARSPGDSGVHLVLEDFTTWVRATWSSTKGTRLFLGNPPYTRAQLLAPEDRRRLGVAAGGLCGTRASLSTLMTAIAVNSLAPADGLCLLLPAQWLESHYAADLRAKIWGLQTRRVELRLVDSWHFDDALVDAVALLIGPEQTSDAPFTVATWNAAEAAELDRQQSVPSQWRALFAPIPPPSSPQRSGRRHASTTTLGELATLRRGGATGNNEFFVPSRETIEEYSLPASSLHRVLRRVSDIADDLTQREFDRRAGDRCRLLVINKHDRVLYPSVHAYLSDGEARKVNEGYLCADRQVWYDLSAELFEPDVIISAMTRQCFRVIDNAPRVAITNNLYGWNWKPEIQAPMRATMLQWLRSEPGQHALLKEARQQGNGLLKLEPNALRSMPIPLL